MKLAYMCFLVGLVMGCEPAPIDCGDTIIDTGSGLTSDGGKADSGACRFGSADCKGNGSCSTNVLNDSMNCGACGAVCGDARTVSTCQMGVCVIIGCKKPYTICGEGIGCPTNLFKDNPNCGSCGHACDVDAGEQCVEGVCEQQDGGP